MAKSEVTPNRRGVRSRELVLDAAEHVMAEHGYEATSIARVVEEAGIPISSVYHYFGSKEGILLAVMERGAERFFAEMPRPDRRTGTPAQHSGVWSKKPRRGRAPSNRRPDGRPKLLRRRCRKSGRSSTSGCSRIPIPRRWH